MRTNNLHLDKVKRTEGQIVHRSIGANTPKNLNRIAKAAMVTSVCGRLIDLSLNTLCYLRTVNFKHKYI